MKSIYIEFNGSNCITNISQDLQTYNRLDQWIFQNIPECDLQQVLCKALLHHHHISQRRGVFAVCLIDCVHHCTYEIKELNNTLECMYQKLLWSTPAIDDSTEK